MTLKIDLNYLITQNLIQRVLVECPKTPVGFISLLNLNYFYSSFSNTLTSHILCMKHCAIRDFRQHFMVYNSKTIKMMNHTMGTPVSVRLRALSELEIDQKKSLDQNLTCQIFPVRWTLFSI